MLLLIGFLHIRDTRDEPVVMPLCNDHTIQVGGKVFWQIFGT